MSTEPQGSPVAAPSAPPPSPVTIITTGARGEAQTLPIPKTAAEMRELRTQRKELSEQLTGVSARRRDLAEELQSFSDGATRTGLEGRLGVLDQRIMQLETDLATTGRQISSAPAELIAATQASAHSNPEGHFEEGLAVGGGSVLFAALLGFFILRKRWRRRSPNALPGDGESGKRLERLELGMEAIAVEIERISEGQRFVTRLLSESQLAGATPDGVAQGKPAPLPNSSRS